jgi:hypothetical protein
MSATGLVHPGKSFTMRTLTTRAALLLACSAVLTHLAAAGDRFFITTEDNEVEVYDSFTGMQVSGSPIALHGGACAEGRSIGGRYYYVATSTGRVRVIDSLTLNTILSPDFVPANTGCLTADGGRAAIQFAFHSPNVQLQDALGYGNYGHYSFGQGRLVTEITALRNASSTYGADWDTGQLLERSSTTGAVTVAASLGFDVRAITSSRDSRYVLATGPDTLRAMQLGSSGDPTHVAHLDRNTGQVRKFQLIGGGGSANVTFSGRYPWQFFVAGEAGVKAYEFMGNKIYARKNLLGGPFPRDITSDDNGDVYILFDDRVEKWFWDSSSWKLWYSYPLKDKFRWSIEVLPMLDPPENTFKVIQPEWIGLLQVVKMKGWGMPWKLDPIQSSGKECDPGAVHGAMKRAYAWLKKLEDKDGILDPSQVAGFLADAKGADLQMAEQFLDLLLLPGEFK